MTREELRQAENELMERMALRVMRNNSADALIAIGRGILAGYLILIATVIWIVVILRLVHGT